MAHAGVAHADWTFVVTDLDGVALGEVRDAVERQVITAMNVPSTASFKVLVNNTLLGPLLSQDLLLKCYRNNKLLFHGPVLTVQLAADDATATPTVAVTAADPTWRFERRVAGKSGLGTTFNGTDRLTIAESLINTANGETNGETGVRTLGRTCGSTAVYIAGPYKKLSECIADMANTLDGFDWRTTPIEYASGKLVEFDAKATLGKQQDSAVFEYQGRGNMKQPNYIRGIDSLANKVYSIPDDGAASAFGVRSKEDTTSQAARGLFEEVVDTANVTNADLRDAILNDHILFRKNPKQVLTFSPDFDDYSGRVPSYGADYVIGDTVRARVLYEGVSLVDGFVRLYKMQFDIDANNRETLTPTVVQEA